MKIAIFKPQSIRNQNAFGTGEHALCVALGKSLRAEITYMTDDFSASFPEVIMRYLTVSPAMTFAQKALRRLKRRFFAKIPYYKNVSFKGFDWVVTEGIHYPLLKYLEGYQGRVILHDSISTNYELTNDQRNYLNRHFSKAIAVTVNGKIPALYQSNGFYIQTHVIGHGIDLSKIPFRLRTSLREGRLICIGRLSEEKGYPYLLQAIRQLRQQGISVTLDIYGRGPLESSMKQTISELGLSNSVSLKGQLPHEYLLRKLNDYDAFISHPIALTYVAEAFHLGNVEAMANGLPVITTDCGGIPWVVQNHAIQTPQKNVSAIQSAILSLHSNPDQVRKLSENSRSFVEHNYSLEVVLQQWLSVLNTPTR
jgi:glycosyltransferase involved in cell wall biosynthesis